MSAEGGKRACCWEAYIYVVFMLIDFKYDYTSGQHFFPDLLACWDDYDILL